MPKIGANFQFNSADPNFSRDSYATLASMAAVTIIDDGHLAYCQEDGNTYKFNSANEIDPTTGQWRLFITPFPTDYAKETTLTTQSAEIKQAISALRGGTATLEQVKTIVSALTNGLTTADRQWLAEQFAGIDLSSITSRLDNNTYGLQAIVNAISNIDLSSVTDRLDNQTYGLAALKALIEAIPTTDPATASDVNNAKQAILDAIGAIVIPTDYAKEATLQEVKSLIGYTIQEIDAV